MEYKLREACTLDKQMVLDWRNHEDVRAVMFTNHIISKDEHSAWWDRTMQSDDRKIFIFEQDNKPVGVVTIYDWDHKKATAWWGFYLDNAHLNKNERTSIWLALEQAVINFADKTLIVNELYCEMLKENKLVCTLHKRFGFVECEVPDNEANIEKSVIYMKYIFSHNKPDIRPNLFLFSSHNTEFLSDVLKKQVEHYSQFPYKIKNSEFARYQLDLLDKSNVSINNDSAVYMFIERLEDFFPDIYTLPIEESLVQIETRLSEYLSFIKQISNRGNIVYVADFAIQKGFPYSVQEQLSNSKLKMLVSEFNNRLYELNIANIVNVIPYSHIVSKVGQSFSNKYWYLARAPFNLNFLETYAKSIIGCIFATNSLSARALVLDLDNTLWGGVIGDDGIEGVALGGDYPGNIYKELQSLFLALKQRGILLTICSKNTESVALAAIEEHSEMRLRKNDFITWRINWESKSANIKELAAELNLGVQSLCFIDDNPMERAEVLRNVPGIYVPELPEDPADWYQFLTELPELTVNNVSDSDRRRSELYKKRVDIKKAETNFADRKDFLVSLDMHVEVQSLNGQNLERTHQLFNKTNQFNTTTTRYTKEQLQKFNSNDNSQVLHVKLKDKYSTEYEGIAAIVILKKENIWIIDNFVMSCRVMGRDLEHALIAKILHCAKENKVIKVIGRFIASAKNKPVEKLYENNKFSVLDEDWCFDLLKQTLPEEINLLTLNWNI